MHGETGSGKTHLALGLAGQAGVNLIYVQGPRLFSRWLGETERNVVYFLFVIIFLYLC